MMSHARTVQLEPKVEHDVINPSQNEFKSIVENAIREFKPGHASVFLLHLRMHRCSVCVH